MSYNRHNRTGLSGPSLVAVERRQAMGRTPHAFVAIEGEPERCKACGYGKPVAVHQLADAGQAFTDAAVLRQVESLFDAEGESPSVTRCGDCNGAVEVTVAGDDVRAACEDCGIPMPEYLADQQSEFEANAADSIFGDDRLGIELCRMFHPSEVSRRREILSHFDADAMYDAPSAEQVECWALDAARDEEQYAS